MAVKRVLRPERLRRVPTQFSWVDQRLVRDRHLERCGLDALGLYLVLVTVADAQGLSYYGEASLVRLLSMPAPRLVAARTPLPGTTCMKWTVGERMQALVTDAGHPVPVNFPVPIGIDGITPLIGRILIAIEGLLNHENCEIYVFHNQPLAAEGYRPMGKRLLPLDRVWERDLLRLPWPGKQVPEVIGDVSAELAAFIRGYLFVSLFQACAQSLASENASRLAAMQRAEKNIADLLDDLTRNYHRLRQESIDEELRDVISGYEASSASGLRVS